MKKETEIFVDSKIIKELSILLGDQKFAYYLTLFINDCYDTSTQAKQLYINKEFYDLQMLLHKFCASAKSFGCIKLYDSGQKIEELCKKKSNVTEIDPLAKEFIDCFTPTIQQLELFKNLYSKVNM